MLLRAAVLITITFFVFQLVDESGAAATDLRKNEESGFELYSPTRSEGLLEASRRFIEVKDGSYEDMKGPEEKKPWLIVRWCRKIMEIILWPWEQMKKPFKKLIYKIA